MKIPCSGCNQSLEIPEELAGQTIKCPACNASLVVTAIQAPPTSTSRVDMTAPQAAAPQKTAPKKVKNIQNMARICGALIAIGYFLPWVDIVIISFSGYNVIKIVEMAGEFGVEDVSPPLWVYGTYLFVVLGIASAALNKKGLHLVSGVFVMLIVLWGLVDVGGIGEGDGSIFDVIGIGLLITIIAPIGQIIGAFKLEEELKE
jgi:hypothetical protein